MKKGIGNETNIKMETRSQTARASGFFLHRALLEFAERGGCKYLNDESFDNIDYIYWWIRSQREKAGKYSGRDLHPMANFRLTD